MRHVADAVDEDEQADEGDHDEHDGGEGIEHPAEREPVVAELEPAKVEDLQAGLAAAAQREHVREGPDGEKEGDGHGADGQRRCQDAALACGEGADGRGQHGQSGNQPEISNDPDHCMPGVGWR